MLEHPRLWRGLGGARSEETLPTGFRRLDASLPGGGWPRATLIELLLPEPGIGEISLLMPALRDLGQNEAAPRWVTWLAPPHLPYAPALQAAGLDPGRMLVVQARAGLDVLWAMEQALRSGVCAAVLGWVASADDHSLRRLKLAAEEGDSMAFLFRPLRSQGRASPAALRLLLTAQGPGLDVEILKSRGGRPSRIGGLLTH